MKLLAAVDLSRASSYIIEAVHRVAMATDATVHVLHVVIPLPTMSEPALPPDTSQQRLAERYREEEEQLAALVAQLRETGVDATAGLALGDPVKTVLTEAKRLGAELIVMGSHGHGFLFDAVMGSVSSGVLRHTEVPVLVVPVRGM